MMMTLTQPETQVVELFQQLPGKSQRKVLLSLASVVKADREQRLDDAEGQLRELCMVRGLNWNNLTEDEREQFVDTLLHEE